MEENEGGGGHGADSPGVEGDAFECFPGSFEQGVGAFGWCPQSVDQHVAGAVVRRGVAALDRDLDADPGAGVSLVG